MNYDNLFRASLILAPIIFLSGSFYIARYWQIGRHASICWHGGQSKVTLAIFVSLLSICGSFYYLAWWFWLQPNFVIPYFKPLFLIATLGLIAITIAPSHNPKKYLAKVHHIGGAVLFGVMYILAILLASSTTAIHPLIRGGFWLFIAYGPLVLLAMWRQPRLKNATLWVETGYIVLFCIPVACLAI